MTTYRNDGSYRSNLPYKGNFGIYQTPFMRQNISLASNAGQTTNPTTKTSWGESRKTDKNTNTKWQEAANENKLELLPWGKAYELNLSVQISHETASIISLANQTSWADPRELNTLTVIAWQDALELKTQPSLMSWSETYRADAMHASGFLTISHRYESDFYQNKNSYRNFWRYQLPRYQIALDNTSKTNWGESEAKLQDSILPWGGGFHIWGIDKPLEWTDDPRPIPDQPAPAEPDIKEFYNVATDLTVKDVATQTALSIDSINISLDIDSFAWTLTARVLNAASMTLAAPSKLIEVSTMGWSWVFIVESYTKNKGVATTWSITASSQSRTLDAPWQDITSHIEASSTTWKQALESLLPVGWQVTYSNKIDDYTLPAGAWSYIDKTPKGALSELLEAIGAVAIPSMHEKKLHIQPRYKYAPWEYNLPTTEPDAIIHEAMIISESGQYHPAPVHNGAWVSGNNRHGVIVEAVREGTDGLPSAPDTYHDLITDQSAGQQKAKQLIAASGSKTLVTLETIITDEQASPGIVAPGYLVEVQSDGETWRGICLSHNTSGAGQPAITQTLTIERDHGDHD